MIALRPDLKVVVAAQPVDFQRLDALFGQDREAGLDPVVDRQPAVRRGPGPRHERQPTARFTAEN